MTAQRGLQSGKQRQTLLVQRRQIATDATEGGGSRFAAKGAGDLLLHFDHPNITFSLVIVKWHHEAVQESQHRFLIAVQAIQQIACCALLGASFFAGRSLGDRIEFLALSKQTPVLRLPILHFQRMQAALPTNCATSLLKS